MPIWELLPLCHEVQTGSGAAEQAKPFGGADVSSDECFGFAAVEDNLSGVLPLSTMRFEGRAFQSEVGRPKVSSNEAEMDAMVGGVPGIRRDFGPGRSAGSGVEEGVEMSRDVIEAGISRAAPRKCGDRPARYCGMFPTGCRRG